MQQQSKDVESFLRKFEANSNSPDTGEAVTQFAEVFLAAGPDGARTVRASDFSFAVRKRKELFNGRVAGELVLLRAGWSHSTAAMFWSVPHGKWTSHLTGENLRKSMLLPA